MNNSQPKNNILFGVHPVIEALKAGEEIDKILIQKDLRASNMTLLRKLIKQQKVPYTHVPVQKLNKITKKNHQGIIAFSSLIPSQNIEEIIPQLYEEGKIPFILVLDELTDVRNFGSICRTASCAGVNAIIMPKKNSAQINADAIKTSSGALYHIPICRVTKLIDSLIFLKSSGLQVVGCTEKATNSAYNYKYTLPTAIIIGGEEKGISKPNIALCKSLVKIPMFGEISSLNVAVATAIILYEVVKQRL